MSASLPLDVRHHMAGRGVPAQQSPVPVSTPVHVAGSHLFHVAESSTAVQPAGITLPPHLRHVPSSSATSVSFVADAYDISSSGSSTCGGAGCGGSGPESLGVPLPVPAPPTRRMREFIPESKKDGEYWVKRYKNNEAAKRSREKRRANDAVMMRRIHELAAENKRLKLEVDVLRRQLGLIPTTTQSQSSSAASTLDLSAQPPTTDDQLMSRQKLELPPSVTTRFDDSARVVVTTSTYRSSDAVVMVDPIRAERKQLAEETRLHHGHPVYYATPPSAAEWPTACSVSTSSSDVRTFASLPAFGRSTSGNSLPSIGDFCSNVPLQDTGDDDPRLCSSYWSMKDTDQSAGCRAPPLPRTFVDSSPIVIFSDVSSSGDDSVDDAFYGRHVDTLTLRRSVEPVVDGAMVESPLNLSAPFRHQSPVPTTHAYGAADRCVARRSSVDFAPVAVPWLPESEVRSLPAAVKHHADDVLISGRASYACEPQLSRNGSLERDQSSRSTSLSSIASVAWQAGVDMAPPQPPADDVPLRIQAGPAAAQLLAGGRQVRCGLPLKVRHKLGTASTSRTITDDAAQPPYNEFAPGITQATNRL